jgi:nucleotide-binding universal stress UspA family protein
MPDGLNRLIVCTDGSSYGLEACRHASWLAKQEGASILALYVSDLRQFEIPVVADVTGSFGIQPYQELSSQLQELERKRAAAIEKATYSVFEKEGFEGRVEFSHRTGLLVEILKELQEEKDLVVLGKRGENANFDTEHLGSMMERVVRACSGPVWVTSRKFRPIERLILAYDGSPSSRKALHFLANCKWIKALELHVVTISEGNDGDRRNHDLMEAEDRLNQYGLHPKCQMLTGDAEGSIASFVKERGMDLLVMGAYGHSRIRYLLIGSTTTAMIRSCQIPVLCFR